MAMVIDTSIYTLLLPPQKMSEDRFQKLSHIKNFDTPLESFWHYLENFMKKFYGINLKYFSDYLKEADFKYNTQEDERLDILLALWESYEKNPLHVSFSGY